MFKSPGGIALELGPLSLHWYGLLIGAGIVVAYILVIREARRRGISIEHIDNMAFWVILGGILGARLYYVLFNLPYYTQNAVEILKIWRGGLAIHGALLGGATAFFIYAKLNKLQWAQYFDMILPGVLLAQAIGRWGNFFNNEAFGSPTSLPWKLFIPEQFRPQQYAAFEFFHPTFLYESLWALAGVLILIFLNRYFYRHKRFPAGLILCGYLVWYSIGRFFIESLRTDSLYLGSLRVAQLVSVVFLVGGFVGAVRIIRGRDMLQQ